ncbi:ImmA/IrrE family metallo-endopeptidase [Marinimicrobium sp. LS-A18]|uniref:helix-turn-helix domain-containing protein n=1 Tax=Marinimicrobium sp. LS-A18 TaxID=1381596 RepID=UPI0004654149|nr:XRE family transcriptional regulator [Marinimicrobium sp. LS-A18]
MDSQERLTQFGQRLLRARKAAGLSMKALAGHVGLSANAIKKYEHGANMPTSANLLKLAKALEVRTEYFFRPVNVTLERVEYRKRSGTSQALLNQVTGDVMDQVERWAELLTLYPDSVKPVPAFALPEALPTQVSTDADIEALAEQMRNAWALGMNPIPDMIDTLEARGIQVITTDVPANKKVDGLAGKVGDMHVVVISSNYPGDRQRFTLAHELGHLVLHGRLSESLDEEKACNRFAGAFLLPEAALRQQIGAHRSAIEPRELYMLKHEFGVSMMAILVRLRQCGVISEALYKQTLLAFNGAGWRTKEPGDPYLQEQTIMFEQLVYRALSEGYIGESKAAELLGQSLSHFHRERKLGGMDAIAHQ